MTDVTADMGPEAPRERIIGKDDLPRLRTIVDEGLRKVPREPPVPTADWVTTATELLLNAPEASHSASRFDASLALSEHRATTSLAVASLSIVVLVCSLLAILLVGAWGIAVAVCLMSLAVVTCYRLMIHHSKKARTLALVAVIASVLVGGLAGLVLRLAQEASEPQMRLSPIALERVKSSGIDVNELPCSVAYVPCVLEMPWERNCEDIGFRVDVVGQQDPYRLDSDGDGEGCTLYPESTSGEAVDGTD